MRPEPAGDPRDSLGELAVIPGIAVVADRRLLRQATRDIEEEGREVHQ
jgi:hypothetical protein